MLRGYDKRKEGRKLLIIGYCLGIVVALVLLVLGLIEAANDTSMHEGDEWARKRREREKWFFDTRF